MISPEWVTAVSSAIVAASAVGAAVSGVSAISAWRREIVGRPRIEFALELLEDFRKARDTYAIIRNPLVGGGEEARPGRKDEEVDLRLFRDSYYPVWHKLMENRQFFDQLDQKRYRAIALFGSGAEIEFERLKGVYVKISTSARAILSGGFPRPGGELSDVQREWLETVHSSGTTPDAGDTMSIELSSIVLAVEKRYRPLIEGTKRGRIPE